MPTQLIKKYIEEFARWLRNQQDYDDFEYGTEVIPGDKTWCKKCESCSCKMKGKNNN
jgi:hypothetical protein